MPISINQGKGGVNLVADPMASVDFYHQRRVRWSDTDASGFVHFANYLRYMEETEYAFLRSLGLSVVSRDERGTIGFPRLAAQLEVVIPARFPDELRVWMQVAFNNGVKIHYQFEIDREGQVIALGRFEVACCRFFPQQTPRAILIPEIFLDRLPLRP